LLPIHPLLDAVAALGVRFHAHPNDLTLKPAGYHLLNCEKFDGRLMIASEILTHLLHSATDRLLDKGVIVKDGKRVVPKLLTEFPYCLPKAGML
jgi:hypothetical protein